MTRRGTKPGRGRWWLAVVGLLAAAVPTAPLAPAHAQMPGIFGPPRPPGTIPGGPTAATPDAPPPGPPGASLVAPPPGPPGASLVAPGGGVAPPAPPPPMPPPPSPAVQAAPAAPMVPAGQVALQLSARFGREPAIPAGLHWRVFSDRPDQNGAFRLIKEDRSASPTFVLPPGGYVVHCSFGLAKQVRRVQLRSETVREVFEIAAGGARFEGRVGDSRIPAGQISFDIYMGSQFEPGDKRPMVEGVGTGEVVLLPEGGYHVVSNYGDGNALVRSDIRVQAGKLIDVTVNHRAAVITLKLVGDRGGEALANTAWSVLTPGGDVIKESIGAFPKVILAEGDYVAIARNEGRVFNRDFKVEPGFDREIEVVAR